jgi:hypothetical protein
MAEKAHPDLGGVRVNSVDRHRRPISPAVLNAAEEIGRRALGHAEKLLIDPAVAVNLLEEAAAAVSRVMIANSMSQHEIRDLNSYLFRAFLRRVNKRYKRDLSMAESLNQNVPVRKEDSREPVLQAHPGVPFGSSGGSRKPIQCGEVQQSNSYEGSVVQINVRVGYSAPILKPRVAGRELRSPEFIAVVHEFHGPNRPGMIAHLNKDGIEPALSLSVLEEAVADPEHQMLPVLRNTTRRHSSRC